MRDIEDVAHFAAFALCAFLTLHGLHELRVRQGRALYHVTERGGGIVYRDYWTTNPPPVVVRHPVAWYETLTNYPAK